VDTDPPVFMLRICLAEGFEFAMVNPVQLIGKWLSSPEIMPRPVLYSTNRVAFKRGVFGPPGPFS